MSLTFLFLFCISASGVYAQAMKEIKRDSFSLKYPANWKIDTEDEDYDSDALFSIDAPDDQNLIMFLIFNMAIDADIMLDEQVKTMSESVMKKPEISDFTKWGKYTGKGKILKGKILGAFKGSIKLFFYADKNKSMLVMEYLYDSASDTVKSELISIADSFSFKN